MNWFTYLIKLSQAQGIQTVVTKNKYGDQFFTIYGNTIPIKEQLKNMGFKYFKGRWGTKVDFIKDDVARRQQLEELGVDTSVLDSVIEQPKQQQQKQQQPQEPQEPQEPVSETDQQLAKMKNGVEEAIEEAKQTGNSAAASLLSYVDSVIEKLANQVDDTAAEEFVKQFLAFSAKFWNYSFGNQMLIWIQRPEATQVAGEKQWFEKFGRQVANRDNPINILAPMSRTSNEGQKIKKQVSSEEWNKIKDKYEYIMFRPVKVYDISDTEVVPGWKGPEGEGPYEGPGKWEKDDNEQVEEMTALIEAGIDWAKDVGISIDSKELREGLGGYSSGQSITINDKYEGVRKFSTLVHELAHEVLHQTEEGKKQRQEISRQDREVDAESTAYIVLNHYGFETKDSPSYLALWKAKGEDIKKRRENIAKAVRTIIHGIDKKMSQVEMDVS